jgi:hypothetical protein
MTDTDLKERWIAALRSGDYKQGRASLRDHNNNFCCLGVLCDVYDPTKWDTPEYSYEGEFYYLPTKLEELIGFYKKVSPTGSEVSVSIQGNLTMLNDGLKFDFDQIADYIESDYTEIRYEGGRTVKVDGDINFVELQYEGYTSD